MRSAGAYGVGNQAIVANVGSDTVMDVTQYNAGDVSANAALAGDGGGMALASSAAYGNSVSGSLCAYCDDGNPTLTAANDQTNDGAVSARASVEHRARPHRRRNVDRDRQRRDLSGLRPDQLTRQIE